MTDQLERLLELVEQESEDESPEWEQENLLPTFWQGWGGGREQQDRAGGQAPEKDRLTGEKTIMGLERMSAPDEESGTGWERNQGRRGQAEPWDREKPGRSLWAAGETDKIPLESRERSGWEGGVQEWGSHWQRPFWREAIPIEQPSGPHEQETNWEHVENMDVRTNWGELPQLGMAGVAETERVWNTIGLYRSVAKTQQAIRASRQSRAATTDRQMSAGAPSLTVDELDRAVRRDSRRYDGAMQLY